MAIRAEGLGKQYRLGEYIGPAAQADTLREAVALRARSFGRRLGWRADHQRATRPERYETFWALRDVSFEVGRGESLAIVGRNGAGKSTLLKLLARVTKPTEGFFEISGRVSSILEVGTGFHPDLTGRENVFMNGAIMGMSREEVEDKFESIVDFSEVRRFMDTPVKRFSSGMKVRLAFAVAVHLDAQVLVFDEVLAVGDIAFREKCMERIIDMRDAGRTILFVSHSMARVRMLGHRAMLLRDGRIVLDGDLEEVVDEYMRVDMGRGSSERAASKAEPPRREDAAAGAIGQLVRVSVIDHIGEQTELLDGDKGGAVRIEFELTRDHVEAAGALDVYVDEELAFGSRQAPVRVEAAGRYVTEVELPPNILAPRQYRLKVSLSVLEEGQRHVLRGQHDFLSIRVDGPAVRPAVDARLGNPSPGVVAPHLTWNVFGAGEPAP